MAMRRWPIIAGVMLLSTAYTLNSVRNERPQYRSRATVRLVDASRAMAGDMADRSAMSAQMPFSAGADPIQSQLQVLQSEAVASTAVDVKGLRLIPADGKPWATEISDVAVDDNAAASSINATFGPTSFTLESSGRSVSAPYGAPAQLNGVRITVASRPKVASTTFQVIPKESAIAGILEKFRASGRPQTDIIDLAYADFEPNQATRVANAMAEAYQLYNATSARQFSRRRLAFLETQLRQSDSTVNEAARAYTSFRSGRDQTAASAIAESTSFSKVEGERSDLESQKRTLESLLARARQPGQTAAANVRAIVSSPGVSSNPLVAQLISQLGAEENVRDNLVTSGAAPSNPDLIAVTSQIANTNARLIDAVESQRQSVDTRLESLNRSKAGTGYIPRPLSGDPKEAQLGSDVQTAQKLQADLKAELQKAKMAEAVEAGQVEIVQLSRSPGYQVSTGAPRKLFLGLVVGLMFGFGIAVLLENLDKSIRRRGDIEPLLGMPGLVVIPRIESSGGARTKLLPSFPGRAIKLAEAAQSNSPLDLITLTNPRSMSAEAFRTLRTNLMFSQAVSEMRLLVVTSASPNEGKTVTAANLAVSFAQQGMRVLLIDCDLRKGRMHRVMNVPREPGMSDFILGFATEEQATRNTAVGGLYMIPTGKLPPNPAELLGGEHAPARSRL